MVAVAAAPAPALTAAMTARVVLDIVGSRGRVGLARCSDEMVVVSRRRLS